MNPLRDSKFFLFRYLWNLMIAVDQLANAILAGDPDETMSSRFGKWLTLPHDTFRWKLSYCVCMFLHWFDDNHCTDCIEPDEGANSVWKNKKK